MKGAIKKGNKYYITVGIQEETIKLVQKIMDSDPILYRSKTQIIDLAIRMFAEDIEKELKK